MKVSYHYYDSQGISLGNFADDNGVVKLEMDIVERDPKVVDPQCRFYAKFRYCQVKGDWVLSSRCGEGSTPEAAMRDYAKNIQGEVLVYDANGTHIGSREIEVPTRLYY